MKLKKLILSGFKSFADRTEFEFDEGITCIVGPNGCGKSNIVDAFKWVLGEQSAKSLRGSEMMDVIFNGSASRKSSGSAQVTLIFDNSSGLLQPDVNSDKPANGELSITRRLFRSGHSEYLINKAPARLKDIREMFMDTGAGIGAYNLIEQGRVEAFLQAGRDERRAIFDEAAGISKYKAKKKEALRKLERVGQNILRINDIMQEVEKHLRAIKYQAGKARNYQRYSQRLKELRSIHLLAQYHQLSQQRSSVDGKLNSAGDSLAAISTRIDQLEASRSSTEIEAVDLERTARDLQGRIATIGGQITTCQERVDLFTARVKELGDQIVAASAKREELEAKIEAFEAQVAARREELQQLDQQAKELAHRHEAVRAEYTSSQQAVAELSARLEDEKAGTIDLMRRTANLHNRIQGLQVHRENLHGQRDRLTERSDRIGDSLKEMLTARAKVGARLDDVRGVLHDSQEKLDQTTHASHEAMDTQQHLQEELSNLRQQRSSLLGRCQSIEEMQARREGIGSAVRRVLEAGKAGRLGGIRGMLGDFLQTDMQHAPVVEAALGGADQYLLADSGAEIAAAVDRFSEVLGNNGAVEILCLDRLGTFKTDFDISRCGQAVARVIDWVQFDPAIAPAVWRLLGKTLVVRTLDDAFAAATHADEYRFVTLGGDVLEPDGRIRLGSAGRAAGVIARRSELAELESQQDELAQRIAELEKSYKCKHDEREHLEKLLQSFRTAIYEANTERVECQSRLAQLDEQIDQLQREKPLIAGDLEDLAEQIDSAVREEHETTEKAAEVERINQQRQEAIGKLTEQIAAARQRQDELAGEITDSKVALAQGQEKMLACRETLSHLDRQREQMARDLESASSEIEVSCQRRKDAQSHIESARGEAESLYEQLEKLNGQSEEVDETRRGLAEKLDQIRQRLGEHRKSHEEATEDLNRLRVELSEVDVRIENLITRATDEMAMALPELYKTYEHDDSRDWQAISEEIHELREKIERLGNVNLDAITEQEDLDRRREFLGDQLKDIASSQRQLTDLIRRINKESRQLFLESFEAIRKNFRELFRKLFGGGRADIMLLDEEDVLESGIEIVARPPGKELRSLSLLSGGEKTLTTLAMLFSIFRSRPSPFCLLDEVDAALDEANNERFNHLVREFVDNSQFLIISHAKRTMSLANVLYGVTMQEPGVSKRISVRFEDAANKLSGQLEPVGA